MGASLVAALAGLGCGALAQEPAHEHDQAAPPACSADTLALQGLAGWDSRTPLKATPGAYDLAVARLEVGRAVDATLAPLEKVEFVIAPERWPEPQTYAGMFAFDAPVAGTYKVAISGGAWIDVVRDEKGSENDKLVPSGKFGHGPGCGDLRKVVEFDLEPGRHVLQLSAMPENAISVMVAYKPDPEAP